MKKQKTVEVLWREFTTTVQPTGPIFKTVDVRKILITALKGILDLHKIKTFPKKEEKVYFKLFFIFYFCSY